MFVSALLDKDVNYIFFLLQIDQSEEGTGEGGHALTENSTNAAEAGMDDEVSAISSKEESISTPITGYTRGPCEGVGHTDPAPYFLFHPPEGGSEKEGFRKLIRENRPTGRTGQNDGGKPQKFAASSVKLEVQDINELDKVGQVDAPEFRFQEKSERKAKRRHPLNDGNDRILSTNKNNISLYPSKEEIRPDYLKVNKTQKKTRENEKCLQSTTETPGEHQNANHGKRVNSTVFALDNEGCGAPHSAASAICAVCGRGGKNMRHPKH